MAVPGPLEAKGTTAAIERGMDLAVQWCVLAVQFVGIQHVTVALWGWKCGSALCVCSRARMRVCV